MQEHNFTINKGLTFNETVEIKNDLGDAPIFINPGEFIALVGKFLVGTATASQVINFTYTPIYGWE